VRKTSGSASASATHRYSDDAVHTPDADAAEGSRWRVRGATTMDFNPDTAGLKFAWRRPGGVGLARTHPAIDRSRVSTGTPRSCGGAEPASRRPLREGGPRLFAEDVSRRRDQLAELVAWPDRSTDRAGPGPDPRCSEQAWTLTQLASYAAMSRTAFAQRFRSLVGQTPVSYIATWRM